MESAEWQKSAIQPIQVQITIVLKYLSVFFLSILFQSHPYILLQIPVKELIIICEKPARIICLFQNIVFSPLIVSYSFSNASLGSLSSSTWMIPQ